MPSLKTCAECGTVYMPKSWNSYMTPICSEKCKKARREARRKIVTIPCTWCGTPVECKGRNGLARAIRGKAYCSDEHMQLYRKKVSSETMTSTNKAHASRRMKKNNPMSHPEVIEKMSRSKQGRTFLARGGNGQLTEPQKRLAERLGLSNFMEYVIETRPVKNQFPSLPNHYKVDIANPSVKLAIEVDGQSHKTKKWKFLDQRKTGILEVLEWKVLRFSNQEVIEHLEDCVQMVTFITSKLKETTTTS